MVDSSNSLGKSSEDMTPANTISSSYLRSIFVFQNWPIATVTAVTKTDIKRKKRMLHAKRLRNVTK